MENASKALIIAGGTILGIMILSIMLYLFRAGGRVSQRIDDKQIYYNIQMFNQQFENFAGTEEHVDRETGAITTRPKGNTISDVITCINLASDANRDVGYNALNAVSVELILDDSHVYSVVGIIPLERNYVLVGHADTLDSTYRANSNANIPKLNVLELRNKPISELHISLPAGVTASPTETLGECVRDLKTNKMIYKYEFEVPEDGIEYYHAATRGSNNKSYDGRVNKITLKLRVNSDYANAIDDYYAKKYK